MHKYTRARMYARTQTTNTREKKNETNEEISNNDNNKNEFKMYSVLWLKNVHQIIGLVCYFKYNNRYEEKKIIYENKR